MELNVAVIGENGVGKTAILKRFVKDTFDSSPLASRKRVLTVQGKQVELTVVCSVFPNVCAIERW